MLDAVQIAKRKKRMIIAIISVLVALILVWLSVLLLENIEKKNSADNNAAIDYNFYYADFSENIFEDQEYLTLIEGEGIRYCEGGLTVSIDESTIGNYGKDIVFFWDFIHNIINGNKDEYNAMFSDQYYKYNAPKQEFTMQKLYEVQISKYSTEQVETSSGNYTKSVFVVEYRILKNNGTFRNDIGDGIRPQYITVTNKSGDFLIDSIGYIKY